MNLQLGSAWAGFALVAVSACGGTVTSDAPSVREHPPPMVPGDDPPPMTPGIPSEGGELIELAVGERDALLARACVGLAYECDLAPIHLELVIDLSAPMGRRAPSHETYWAMVRPALQALLSDRMGHSLVGLTLFPQRTPDQPGSPDPCGPAQLEVAPGPLDDPAHAATLRDALAAAMPSYETPLRMTLEAYQHAVAVARQHESYHEPVVVLVTSGGPAAADSCTGTALPSDPEPLLGAIAAAAQTGVKTIIVGAPGSNISYDESDPRPWMSQAATLNAQSPCGVDQATCAGCECSDTGTPRYCHVDWSGAVDLDELAKLLEPVCPTQCSFDLSSDIETTDMHFLLTTTSHEYRVTRSSTEPCTQGWHLTPDGRAELCPLTCARVRCTQNSLDRGTTQVIAGCGPEP